MFTYLRDRSHSSMYSGLAEPNNQLARFSWSVSEILWRHTICCNAPTPNNPHNSDPDYLATRFSVQWHWSTGRRTCTPRINGVLEFTEQKNWLPKSGSKYCGLFEDYKNYELPRVASC